MNILDLIKELDLCEDNSEVFIEVNNVVHKIYTVEDTSQGVILVVDTDEEDKEMR